MMMGSDSYRDYFLDLFDMLPDLQGRQQVYSRLSFGPGQRYATKGCSIVQYSEGPDPVLVVKSAGIDW
jgi:hypothetical protein